VPAEHAAAVPHARTGVARRRVLARRARARSLAAERRVAWATRPGHFPRPSLAGPAEAYPHVVHETAVPLQRADGDPILEAGKRVNVALAATRLDGLALDPGRPLSFWRAVGRVRERDGYRHGMELRGGCIVPALGGGLCLLSNALFAAAVRSGWRILERHGHTMEAIPPAAGQPWGLDATVAYPYIDLRFELRAGDAPSRLGVAVRDGTMVLEVRSRAPLTRSVRVDAQDDRIDVVAGQRVRRNRLVRHIDGTDGATLTEVVAVNAKRLLHDGLHARSCLTCGLTSCAGRVEVSAGERRAAEW
jgi:vancomycin resistance protein VanW